MNRRCVVSVLVVAAGFSAGNACDAQVVSGALSWLMRHQEKEGNWSFKSYTKLCADDTCTGPGRQESLSAATALALLPMLAAGQTHVHDGEYKKAVGRGINWLVAHQKPDGDLSAGAEQQMYSHAFAALALCEVYGMTKDAALAAPAQRAIDFIQDAQNERTGGWRYHPGQEGDTSVLGWQVTALKSAQLAGLQVKVKTLDGAKKWLASVSKSGDDGKPNGRFSYFPESPATPTMSAVGLVCSRHLGLAKSDPLIAAGVKYLAANPPDNDARNVYYWFYGTQIMQNADGYDSTHWIHRMRKYLSENQAREGCAAGSWSPDKPTRDAWGPNGGRLMTTSFSCLTLEVYYRYLSVFKDSTAKSDSDESNKKSAGTDGSIPAKPKK